MPRGIPAKKPVEVPKPVEEKPKPNKPEGNFGQTKKEEKKEVPAVLTAKCSHPQGCQCLDVLGPGQAYFENGEDGYIMIGDASKNQAWYRGGNKGKGLWINKRR